MRVFYVISVMFYLVFAPGLSASPHPVADDEIEFLLKHIASSDSRFIRSGTEYGPQEAAAHLRMKLRKAGSRVHSAEDFIDGVASKSFLTGKPYLIKFPQGTTRLAGQWLNEALAQYRTSSQLK